MPSFLVLLATTVFVGFLFWRDLRLQPRLTGALWIPLIWLVLTASRPVSAWLGVGEASDTSAGLVDGSPLDRMVFMLLELAGLFVLLRRGVSWSTVVSRNLALTIFLAYCGLATLWSDFPFVALKRWIKDLGVPIMVLILATEPDPREAMVSLLKRAAYVLAPFSILLIKYYPDLGRGFDGWTGNAINIGVTTNKNELGYVCLMFGFFFFWYLLATLRRQKGPERRKELFVSCCILYMIGWLLFMADSATSLMSLTIGMSIVVFLGLPFINTRHAVAYLVGGLLMLSCAETIFGITDIAITAVGRDSTLTGRVNLWERLRLFDINPLIGVGFESFWLGPRIEELWAQYWWRPNQAHNGYLETYLNLGWIGVILLVIWILRAFATARQTLFSDFDLGRFQLGVFGIMISYNYTEAAFKILHPLSFLFYIIAMDYPRAPRRLSVSNFARDSTPRREMPPRARSIRWKTTNPEPDAR